MCKEYYSKHFLCVATPHSMWNLKVPNQGSYPVPCSGSVKSHHWTTRRVPLINILACMILFNPHDNFYLTASCRRWPKRS